MTSPCPALPQFSAAERAALLASILHLDLQELQDRREGDVSRLTTAMLNLQAVVEQYEVSLIEHKWYENSDF
jgi:hypothetical protein